jgi:hypothetical protein
MIVSAPWNNPAAPSPAIARPTMNALELGAAAQIVEPTEKLCDQMLVVDTYKRE